MVCAKPSMYFLCQSIVPGKIGLRRDKGVCNVKKGFATVFFQEKVAILIEILNMLKN
jgi:hypothetical protein